MAHCIAALQKFARSKMWEKLVARRDLPFVPGGGRPPQSFVTYKSSFLSYGILREFRLL